MTRKTIAVRTLVVTVLVITLVSVLASLPMFVRLISIARHSREANDIVLAVEHYRSKMGRLPSTLGDIGQAEIESSEIFYEKRSESDYIVWYGLELGESMTYSSSKKQWDDY